MGLVYGNAVVTLLAVTGRDPSHGLAGVESKRPVPWIETIVGNVLLRHELDHLSEISSSQWATRGWTLQESYLSKRRLFFTERQVMFMCNQERLYEHTTVNRHGERVEELFGPGSNAILSMDLAPKTLIRLYSKRSLRDHDDAYNAISAMLNAITGSEKGYAHIWSIILTRPRRPYRQLQLLWVSAAEGVRRKNFPSWSPLGWTSPIEIILELSGFKDSEGLVEFRTQQGWTMWNELTTSQIEDLRVDLPDQSRLLRVTGMTFNLSLEWGLPSTDSRESRQLYCSGIDNFRLEPSWDCSPEQLTLGDSVTCVVVQSMNPTIMLLRSLETRPRCVTPPESCNLVTYERVGMIVLMGLEMVRLKKSIWIEFTRLFVDGRSSVPKSDKIKGEKQTFLLA